MEPRPRGPVVVQEQRHVLVLRDHPAHDPYVGGVFRAATAAYVCARMIEGPVTVHAAPSQRTIRSSPTAHTSSAATTATSVRPWSKGSGVPAPARTGIDTRVAIVARPITTADRLTRIRTTSTLMFPRRDPLCQGSSDRSGPGRRPRPNGALHRAAPSWLTPRTTRTSLPGQEPPMRRSARRPVLAAVLAVLTLVVSSDLAGRRRPPRRRPGDRGRRRSRVPVALEGRGEGACRSDEMRT